MWIMMVDYLDSTRIVNGLTGEISPWEFPWGTDDGGFPSIALCRPTVRELQEQID